MIYEKFESKYKITICFEKENRSFYTTVFIEKDTLCIDLASFGFESADQITLNGKIIEKSRYVNKGYIDFENINKDSVIKISIFKRKI